MSYHSVEKEKDSITKFRLILVLAFLHCYVLLKEKVFMDFVIAADISLLGGVDINMINEFILPIIIMTPQ